MNLAEQLAAYSRGDIARRDLESATGLGFAEIIGEMRKLGLPLPRYDNRCEFTEKQREIYNSIFARQG